MSIAIETQLVAAPLSGEEITDTVARALMLTVHPVTHSVSTTDERIHTDPQALYNEMKEGIVSPVDARLVHADTPFCLLYTSPSPRDATLSRMPSSA